MGTSNLTLTLAEFAHDTRVGQLPDAIVHAARRTLLDFCGVAVAGSRHPGSVGLRKALGSSGSSPIIGTPVNASACDAALINGFAAHVFDWDDTVLPARAHFGATLLPAILAESVGRNWKMADLVAALAVGFEIQARMSSAMYPAIHENRWHTTSVVAPAGVAAALGRLLGSDPHTISHGMGLAANSASGLMSGFGTSAKALNVGRASAWGLLSAKLALDGLEAHLDTLDMGGYLDRFAAGADKLKLLDGLGNEWALGRNGFKPYPCGFVAHPAIDAVRDVLALALASPLIHMTINVAPEAIELMGRQYPESELEAKFSLYYVAAVAWTQGHVTPENFSTAAIGSERIQKTMAMMAVSSDPSLSQCQACVEAAFEDGTRLTVSVNAPRGSEDRPLSDQELTEKFLAAVGESMREAEILASRILDDENLDIQEITGRLSF